MTVILATLKLLASVMTHIATGRMAEWHYDSMAAWQNGMALLEFCILIYPGSPVYMRLITRIPIRIKLIQFHVNMLIWIAIWVT